jgi:hypothetical protein
MQTKEPHDLRTGAIQEEEVQLDKTTRPEKRGSKREKTTKNSRIGMWRLFQHQKKRHLKYNF